MSFVSSNLVFVLLLPLSCAMQYHDILDRVITVPTALYAKYIKNLTSLKRELPNFAKYMTGFHQMESFLRY